MYITFSVKKENQLDHEIEISEHDTRFNIVTEKQFNKIILLVFIICFSIPCYDSKTRVMWNTYVMLYSVVPQTFPVFLFCYILL